MTIPEIRTILLADSALMALISAIEPKPSKDTKNNIIMFEETPTSNNGVTNRVRIQFTVVCDTEEQFGHIYARICEDLLTPDDRPLTQSIRKVEINGGGSLYDSDRRKYHKIIYLNILARS
jgi:hypothetical protein